MTDYSAREVEKRYKNLPIEVKELLYSSEMSFVMQQVGQKHRLHLDQIDKLNTETGQVMLGFVDANEFVSNLEDMLGVDKQRAEAIAKDVSDMLFSKIRDAMKQTFEMSKEPTSPAPSQPSAVSAAPVSKLPPLTSRPVPPPTTPPAAPTPPPVAHPATPTPPATPALPISPDVHKADIMLTEKTIEVPKPTPGVAPITETPPKPAEPPKSEPPKPQNYKADPYREPIE